MKPNETKSPGQQESAVSGGDAPSRSFPVILIAFLMAAALMVALLTSPEEAGRSKAPATATPGSGTEEVSYGGTFLEGSIGDAKTLNPLYANDNASSEIISLIFNGLVKYSKDLEVIPDLADPAAKWEVLEGGTVFVFHLRKDVFWHDGTRFTSADVVFSYELAAEEKTKAAYRSEFGEIASVTATDEFTVKVAYKRPYCESLGLQTWMLPVLPKHILEGGDVATSSFNRRPIGTGPFKFKEWIPDEKIVLVANDGYFEGRPYLDRFIFRIVPQKSNMFLMLKNGTIDMMRLTPDQYIKQARGEEFDLNFSKFKFPGLSYTYLGMNMTHPILSDLKVRTAISHAIDRSGMISNILTGLGSLANGPFIPNTWACNPGVTLPSFDPGKARELLISAGWKDSNGDGVVEKVLAGSDRPVNLSFTILTNNGNEERRLAGEIIRENLLAVGIDAKFERLSWTSLMDTVDSRKFEAVCLGWDLPIDPDQFNIWHSSCIAHGNNFVNYSNPSVDKLLEEGRVTLDQARRKTIYQKIHELIVADAPYVFLFVPDMLYSVDRRFRNVDPTILGIKHNIAKWYVPKVEQR